MKIIIATGASGGHIFPALSLAEEFKDKHDIIFVCEQGKSEILIEEAGFKTLAISIVKPRSLKNMFSFIFSLVRSFGESLRIINSFKPEVAVGFGSFVSFPLIAAAKIKGLPTVIHEQNAVPGLANRILANFSNKIAVSFSESNKYFPGQKRVLTGCPVRPELLKADKASARQFFNLKSNKFTILVLGGSQGSHNINVKFMQVLREIKEKDNLQVIHLTGSADYEWVRSEYQKIGIEHCVFAFLKEMGYAYKSADLVISRAGASAIAEIALLGVPAILVPYPFARAHQLENARAMADKGAAVLIKDADLSAQVFKGHILRLLNNRCLLQEMAQKARDFSMPYAAKDLANVITGLVR